MNIIEMQYKADTGMLSKIEIKSEKLKHTWYGKTPAVRLAIMPLNYVIEKRESLFIPKPEYIKWIEEKLESCSDLLASQLRNKIDDLEYELFEQKQENSELEDKIYQQECEIDELKDEIETLQKSKP